MEDKQRFSQDIIIGCPNIHIWGELGVQFLINPIALYKNMDIRVSKISNRVSKRHPDTPLAKGLKTRKELAPLLGKSVKRGYLIQSNLVIKRSDMGQSIGLGQHHFSMFSMKCQLICENIV